MRGDGGAASAGPDRRGALPVLHPAARITFPAAELGSASSADCFGSCLENRPDLSASQAAQAGR